MKRIQFKTVLPYLVAMLIFVLLSVIYFHPVLEGYRIKQGDIRLHRGMSHELRSHKDKFEEEPLWVGNMFAGMPSYQVSTVRYDGNLIHYVHQILSLGFPYPISLMIIYMIGFFILLMCLRVNPWLAIIGSLAYAFSSYFIIIIEAGHTSKGFALAYAPPLLGGVIAILRGRLLIGFLITALFMGLQLFANHLQITYYLLFIILAVGLAEMINRFKEGEGGVFFKRVGIAALAVLLGILPNLGNILLTYEYAKFSTRGVSELTINPDNTSNETTKSSGLDKDYITQWSYGIEETATLFLPNAKGGKSGAILSDEAQMEKLRRQDPAFFNFMVEQYQQSQFLVNTYWGDQPFTSGPVYVGIIVFYLALLAFFFVKDRLVVALGIVSLLAIILSWGKNFMGFSEFFIDHAPLYNKFRAVSMILVIVELALPVLAVLFLHKLIRQREVIATERKKFFYVSGGFTALLLLFWLLPDTFFTFLSADDKARLGSLLGNGGANSNTIYSHFDKIAALRMDTLRADVLSVLKYLIAAIAILYLFLIRKMNAKITLVSIGALILIDLWVHNKNYLNNEKAQQRGQGKYVHYQPPEQLRAPYEANPVDKQILQVESSQDPQLQKIINENIQEARTEGRLSKSDIESLQFTTLMRNTHYRVLNTLKRLDEDAQTAYFHKTLGGYHGAKLKKYQELVDFELGMEHQQLRQAFLQGGRQGVLQMLPQMNTVNMLNTKYIIGAVSAQGGSQMGVVKNPYNLGPVWFVGQLKSVANADEEILALKDLDPATTAVIRETDANETGSDFSGSGRIELLSYLPNKLTYRFETNAKQFAVFSEVYYDKGWQVKINGEAARFYKVNYLLRGMPIPAGQGEITFEFKPLTYQVGKYATWFSSLLFLILIVGGGYQLLKGEHKPNLDSTKVNS
jgi:hypothetical protein